MASEPVQSANHGNAYNIFILVLTVASLLVMVLLLLPLNQETLDLLRFYDNAICFIFIGDWLMNMRRTKPSRYYFINERGWLDLLGSIPSLGIFNVGGLLRLARLSRLARISRLLGGSARAALVRDVVDNRGQYATFITLLAAGLVLSTASVLILAAEAGAEGANIKSGGDALWWGLVTITTVGYGDRYPVTAAGRIIATFVMFAGVGIIGALASILASLLVPPPKEEDKPEVTEAEAAAKAAVAAETSSDAVAAELAKMRSELAELRMAVAVDRTGDT